MKDAEKAETVRREGVCGRSSGSSAHAALLTLQAELRTLEKHAEQMRKSASSAGICGRRKISRGTGGGGTTSPAIRTGEIPAAHKDETLEYKRQLAVLGDKARIRST